VKKVKSKLFLETMAEWEYALKYYGAELPWKAILINCTKNQAVSINEIIKLDDTSLKLVTDHDEIIISPENNWRLKHGRTVLEKTIFTHDLSN